MTRKALTFVLLTTLLAPVVAQSNLTIATGSPTGSWYTYGGALAQVITRHLSPYHATAEVTGGSAENLALVFTGQAEVGMATSDVLAQALSGAGPFQGRAAANLRVLAALSADSFLVVSHDMDENLAYALTRLLFEHQEELTTLAPMASETNVVQTLASEGVLLHPGAVQYYLEVGEVVPDQLRDH